MIEYFRVALRYTPACLPMAPDAGLPEDAPEFQYNNKGSLAYIGGDKAVLDPGEALSFLKYVKGWFMGFGWKSAEIAMQASFKNQLSVMYDFVKTKLFGRDISDI